MRSTTVVVIGAGQAGLATSRHLLDLEIDHVVIERGRLANSWRRDRWDSLRLLTPNWMSRLPGWSYAGPDPDGFMTMAEIVEHLDGFARSFTAPVQDQTTVVSVTRRHDCFLVDTDQGAWTAAAVVVATGAFARPMVPACGRELTPSIDALSPLRYRNPSALADGKVLVVGASASGLQIADELARSGREVLLSVGRHNRLPRTYRGMDIHWWLDALGSLDEPWHAVAAIDRARRSPSLQLVGSVDHRDLDLGIVQDRGVRLVGRLATLAGSRARFEDDLDREVVGSDHRLRALLDDIDTWAGAHALDDEMDAPTRPRPVTTGAGGASIDLRAEGVGTVIWATGLRPDHSFLRLPGLGAPDAPEHDGGVARAVPGLYLVGLPFLRRRRSTFIDGVGDDAAAIVDHLADHVVGGLARPSRTHPSATR